MEGWFNCSGGSVEPHPPSRYPSALRNPSPPPGNPSPPPRNRSPPRKPPPSRYPSALRNPPPPRYWPPSPNLPQLLNTGPDLWPKTTKPDVVPPEIIKLPGRPKGARQKTSEERREINNKKANTRKVKICELSNGVQKMSRSGIMSDYTCRKCGEKGHNKRKCPQLIPLESERVDEVSNPNDTQECGKKRRRNRPQHCSLCYQPGHNRSRCTSSVADMYNKHTSSSVLAGTSSGRVASSNAPAAGELSGRATGVQATEDAAGGAARVWKHAGGRAI